MSEHYQPGEIVDVTIEGAPVRYTTESTDGTWLTLAIGGLDATVNVPLAAAKVTRVAPAGGVRAGDVWRDHMQRLWLAYPNGSKVYMTCGSSSDYVAPEQVCRRHGPLTLVHREPEQPSGGAS